MQRFRMNAHLLTSPQDRSHSWSHALRFRPARHFPSYTAIPRRRVPNVLGICSGSGQDVAVDRRRLSAAGGPATLQLTELRTWQHRPSHYCAGHDADSHALL